MLAIIVIGVLSGCLAAAPLQESKAFADAATAVDGAGALILDQLSIAERSNRQAIFAADPNNRYVFDVDDAAYQATIGEPPSTAAFRASLKLTSQYADLLVALTSGRGVDQAKGQVFAMADSVEKLIGLSSLPGISGLGLGAIARQLEPLIQCGAAVPEPERSPAARQ